MYHFRVLCTGGAFPVEMLMREKCWPRNKNSAEILRDSIARPFKYLNRYFMFMASEKKPRSKKWPDNTVVIDVVEKVKKAPISKKRRTSKRKTASKKRK